MEVQDSVTCQLDAPTPINHPNPTPVPGRTFDLGYAKWRGRVKNNLPDGKGTMIFTTSHLIDTNDPDKRVAQAGDSIVGYYENGHLHDGIWYSKQNGMKYLMFGYN